MNKKDKKYDIGFEDEVDILIQNLIDLGLIERDGDTYKLTQRGCDYYRNVPGVSLDESLLKKVQ